MSSPETRDVEALRGLFARLARRDERALEELYRRTSSRVYGLAASVLQDAQAAEEVTLDVYARVWEDPGLYQRERGAPMTWLLIFTRCRAIDRLRSRERERPTEPIAARGEELTDPGSGPTEGLGAAEEQTRLRRALALIPPPQRQAIVASFFGGLTHAEIAERFGVPIGTIKGRIRIGLDKLRLLLPTALEELG